MKGGMICLTFLVMVLLAVIPCVVQASKAIAVSAGGTQVLVLMDDGTVYSWGENLYGELGIGGNETLNKTYRTPHRVLIDNVTAISAGPGYSLALRSDGAVWA